MDRNINKHLAIFNYFEMEKKANELVALKKGGIEEGFCPTCFSLTCDHTFEKLDSYDDAAGQLFWWMDIAKTEAQEELLCTQRVIPHWPRNGEYKGNLPYFVTYKLNIPMVVIYSKNKKYWLYRERGEPEYYGTPMPDGVYYGYMIDDEFHSLHRFWEGNWNTPEVNPLRRNLTETDLKIIDVKPKYQPYFSGYWFIPYVAPHYNFWQGVFSVE